MGAHTSELRRPCCAILSLSSAQSQRSVGVTFHRSYWSRPWLAGEPPLSLYDGYAPDWPGFLAACSRAMSHDDSIAAW